ncbi:dystonin-like [Nyctibius grandis]|uniref:dystonin-like n=1 Tax=Nyctibius grandis TaxID=48427 RepID=UPI0035BC0D57
MEEDTAGSHALRASRLDPFSPARRGLCAPAPPCPSPPARAPTTSLSSPPPDVPPPLGELLSWVSDVSKAWMGSRGARDAAAPRPGTLAQCGWMFIPPPLTAATEPVPPSCANKEGAETRPVACPAGEGHQCQLWGRVAVAVGLRGPAAARGTLPQRPPSSPEPCRERGAAGAAGAAGRSAEGSSPDGEDVERAWQRGERPERRLEVQEQLLALRHWLDAVERSLPGPEPGSAPQASPRAVPVPEEAAGAERAPDTPQSLLAWVADMEELVGNQKPPSAEAKVAKAQLEEQKLLRRLLEERRPRVELALQDRPVPLAHGPGPAVPEGNDGLSGLGERWTRLVQEAEARYGRLERILPAAQAFQEAADSFQEWLVATERQLAQLWHADGCVARLQDAHRQSQALCEEIDGRLAELDGALESGQRVLAMVTGEEAQAARERLESLRLRYVLAGQSGADAAQRLAQALEASARLGPAQEGLAQWLGRVERELVGTEGHEGTDGTGDAEKLEQALASQLAHWAGLGERLEELARVQLDAAALGSQLADQKLLAAEILHHRGLAERLLAVADPLLRACPEPLRQRLQPPR